MYQNEWLPYALSIGIDEERFWTMNPRKMKPYTEAYRILKKEQNFMMYIQGRYFADALLCTVGNMFKDKHSKAFDYPKEPYSLFEAKVELTEEEKQRQRENLILSLKIMQTNFNINHNKGGNK